MTSQPPTRLLALSMVALMLLTACSADASSSAPPPTPLMSPDQWVSYQFKSQGFAISLPRTWVQVSVDADAFDKSVSTIRGVNPTIADYAVCCLEGQLPAWRTSNVRMFALDTSYNVSNPDLVPNVKVKSIRIADGMTLSDVADRLRISRDKDKDGLLDRSILDQKVLLGDLEAWEFTYVDNTFATSATKKIYYEDYNFVHELETYMVRFEVPEQTKEQYDAIFDKIVRTFSMID